MSESLKSDISECRIIDNHLFSDHVPVKIIFNIYINYISEVERPRDARQSWHYATEHDIDTHKDRLNDLLDTVTIHGLLFVMIIIVPSIEMNYVFYITLLLTIVLQLVITCLPLLVQLKPNLAAMIMFNILRKKHSRGIIFGK